MIALILNGMRGQWLAVFAEVVAALAMNFSKKRLIGAFLVLVLVVIAALSIPVIRERMEGAIEFLHLDKHEYVAILKNGDNLTAEQASAFAAYERIEHLRVGLKAVADHPWFGVGIGFSRFNAAINEKYWKNEVHFEKKVFGHTHNTYLQQAILFGITGAVALFLLHILFLGYFAKAFLAYRCNWFAQAGITFIIGTTVGGFSDCLVANNIWYFAYWMVLSLLYAGCRLEQKSINSLNIHSWKI